MVSADRQQLGTFEGRLPDGTPYYGRMGELAYDADEDRVQCHLCGEWFRAIGGSHLRRTHGWTLIEYRDAFHLAMQLPTCSRAVSLRLRASALSLIERGEFGAGAQGARRRPARVRPWRTLAAQHPELLSELYPIRNGGIDPVAIAVRSARKLWWRCSVCGYEWQATAGSRSAGHGCPHCYNERRRGPREVRAEQSLEALYPAVASQWDRQRNDRLDPAAISPNSKLKAWWRCGACDHVWAASVQNRARGHGCPQCGVKRRARAQIRSSTTNRSPRSAPTSSRSCTRAATPKWILRSSALAPAKSCGGAAEPAGTTGEPPSRTARKAVLAARYADSSAGRERRAKSSRSGRSRSSTPTSPTSCTPRATRASTLRGSVRDPA